MEVYWTQVWENTVHSALCIYMCMCLRECVFVLVSVRRGDVVTMSKRVRGRGYWPSESGRGSECQGERGRVRKREEERSGWRGAWEGRGGRRTRIKRRRRRKRRSGWSGREEEWGQLRQVADVTHDSNFSNAPHRKQSWLGDIHIYKPEKKSEYRNTNNNSFPRSILFFSLWLTNNIFLLIIMSCQTLGTSCSSFQVISFNQLSRMHPPFCSPRFLFSPFLLPLLPFSHLSSPPPLVLPVPYRPLRTCILRERRKRVIGEMENVHKCWKCLSLAKSVWKTCMEWQLLFRVCCSNFVTLLIRYSSRFRINMSCDTSFYI